ncbi:MAG: iron ABC transporter substrate-binding protein [Actinobacteria bacterium]|nr:iron ABC transporter substrate-binding protein [Actinomycetota bacterium]
MRKKVSALMGSLILTLSLTACAGGEEESSALVVYSGRTQEYIASIFEDFTEKTGIQLDIRYGDSAALAAQILEVRAPSGDWVALTGRARILAYAPDRVSELPMSVDDLVNPQWKGRLGIAPTNASFQTFVTAMIQMRGETATEKWLRGIVANSPKYFEKNSLIVEAIDAGEIDAGLVNHYYIYEVSQELGRKVNVENHFFTAGDVGNLVNVSGVGVIRMSERQAVANQLVEYLLSDIVQQQFVTDVHEYSVVDPTLKPEGLIPLSEVKAPNVSLASLADLQRTQRLLIKVGLL